VRTHAVDVADDSRLAEALGTGHLQVNSFHHQAVRELAPGLLATAHAEDGVIEGVETPDGDWWVLAVQWHPEEMVADADAPDGGLFRALAGAARAAYCR
jgi:putative glutamine amidotransferase